VLLLTAAKEPQSYLIVNRDRQSDLDACAQSVLASIMINRVGLRRRSGGESLERPRAREVSRKARRRVKPGTPVLYDGFTNAKKVS